MLSFNLYAINITLRLPIPVSITVYLSLNDMGELSIVGCPYGERGLWESSTRPNLLKKMDRT